MTSRRRVQSLSNSESLDVFSVMKRQALYVGCEWVKSRNPQKFLITDSITTIEGSGLEWIQPHKLCEIRSKSSIYSQGNWKGDQIRRRGIVSWEISIFASDQCSRQDTCS